MKCNACGAKMQLVKFTRETNDDCRSEFVYECVNMDREEEEKLDHQVLVTHTSKGCHG